MSETINLNFRIDRDLKEQAEQIFEEVGMNMTTALTIFIRQAVREGKFPFRISPIFDEEINLYDKVKLKGEYTMATKTLKDFREEIISEIKEKYEGEGATSGQIIKSEVKNSELWRSINNALDYYQNKGYLTLNKTFGITIYTLTTNGIDYIENQI